MFGRKKTTVAEAFELIRQEMAATGLRHERKYLTFLKLIESDLKGAGAGSKVVKLDMKRRIFEEERG